MYTRCGFWRYQDFAFCKLEALYAHTVCNYYMKQFSLDADLLVWLHGNPGSPTVASETLGMYEVCAEIGMLSSMSTSKEYNVLVYTESSSATGIIIGNTYSGPSLI